MGKRVGKSSSFGYGANSAQYKWTDLPVIYRGGKKIVQKIAYEVERTAKQNVKQMIESYEPKHPRPEGHPTGNLARSVTTRMEGGTGAQATAYVGTNVEYALYFEMGVKYPEYEVPPRPFLGNALSEAKRKYGL